MIPSWIYPYINHFLNVINAISFSPSPIKNFFSFVAPPIYIHGCHNICIQFSFCNNVVGINKLKAPFRENKSSATILTALWLVAVVEEKWVDFFFININFKCPGSNKWSPRFSSYDFIWLKFFKIERQKMYWKLETSKFSVEAFADFR
jgi:hypothetical protein